MRRISQVLAAVALTTLSFATQPARAQATGGNVRLTAEFTEATADHPARLYITAEIEEGWHIFSVTQKKGGPVRTTIRLTESDQYRLLEEAFTASPPPTIHRYPDAWPDLDVEEHEGTVTWYVPIELAAGINPADVKIEGKVTSQRCNPESCLPPKGYAFSAELGDGVDVDDDEQAAAAAATPRSSPPAAVAEAPAAANAPPINTQPADAQPVFVGSYNNPTAKAEIRGAVSPAVVQPGGKLTLTLTAVPEGKWHVYAWSDGPSAFASSKPTLIEVAAPVDWTVGAPQTDVAIQEESTQEGGLPRTIQYHEGSATWTVTIDVPADVPTGEYSLHGIIGYQTCFAKGCMAPAAAQFAAVVQVQSGAAAAGETPLTFAKSAYRIAEKAAGGGEIPVLAAGVGATRGVPAPQVDIIEPAAAAEAATGIDAELLRQNIAAQGAQKQGSLPVMLGLAFVGGLLLNLMPCVLPVIGLKVMSFVQQAGENRARIFALNMWYSLGLLSVFLVLATLASGARLGLADENLGWGQQFGSVTFNVVLTCVVFVFALSFLGVWEIPIPGFVGGSTANTLALREGFTGAFLKGVLTTVLATPCTGPFMGSALTWSVAQPVPITYAVFTTLGIGMATPYLVIGAFPRLLRLLPRPGAWMDTFKQVMGFVLLGTVIFMLSFISWAYVVPTVALLMTLWFACWWIGRTPLTAELNAKLRAWAGGVTIGLLGAWLSFGWLDDVMAYRFQLAVDQEIAKRFDGADRPGNEPLVARAHNDEGELPWEPFSKSRLAKLTGEGRTVLVDFTAHWCQVCKLNEASTLNTVETRKLVDELGVATLRADKSQDSPEIDEMLRLLGNEATSLPYYAIFPAANPNQPILMDGLLTQKQVLDALRKAGPSAAVQAGAASTAMASP